MSARAPPVLRDTASSFIVGSIFFFVLVFGFIAEPILALGELIGSTKA